MRFILPVSVLSAFMVIFSGYSAYAQTGTYSDSQLAHVRSRCVEIKNTLNQLHASDALLRVNRGQLYESLGSRLMNPFANRVASNGLDNYNFVSTVDSYKDALSDFRKNYITYDKALSAAINTDCSNDTAKFLDNIEIARQNRVIIKSDISRLNDLIGNFSNSFSSLKAKIINKTTENGS